MVTVFPHIEMNKGSEMDWLLKQRAGRCVAISVLILKRTRQILSFKALSAVLHEQMFWRWKPVWWTVLRQDRWICPVWMSRRTHTPPCLHLELRRSRHTDAFKFWTQDYINNLPSQKDKKSNRERAREGMRERVDSWKASWDLVLELTSHHLPPYFFS